MFGAHPLFIALTPSLSQWERGITGGTQQKIVFDWEPRSHV